MTRRPSIAQINDATTDVASYLVASLVRTHAVTAWANLAARHPGINNEVSDALHDLVLGSMVEIIPKNTEIPMEALLVLRDASASHAESPYAVGPLAPAPAPPPRQERCTATHDDLYGPVQCALPLGHEAKMHTTNPDVLLEAVTWPVNQCTSRFNAVFTGVMQCELAAEHPGDHHNVARNVAWPS